MSTATTAKITPKEFLARTDLGRYELVDGELVEVYVSVLSSLVGTIVATKLTNHCEAGHLGFVWGPDNLVRCFADTSKFRKPDACFVRLDRVPSNWLEEAALEVAPDLVVEVLSPNDVAYEVHKKIHEYLEAGVKLVWVIYPETQTVSIHRIDRTVAERIAGEDLEGEDVLPGFCCPVESLFPASPKPKPVAGEEATAAR